MSTTNPVLVVANKREEARAQHLTVVPFCPFVASYMRRYQEYLPLLTEAEQARLQKS